MKMIFAFTYLWAAEGAEDEDCGNAFDRIVYDSRLGLAVEGMQDGLTIESLWRVI
jgi:Bardet-Biedl syndrome 5 protein